MHRHAIISLVFVLACAEPPDPPDIQTDEEPIAEAVQEETPEVFDTVTICMGSDGPIADPDPIYSLSEPTRHVVWVPADPALGWGVVVTTATTPFNDGTADRRVFGPGPGSSTNTGRIKGDLPVPSEYKYTVFYQESPDGELQSADPKVVISEGGMDRDLNVEQCDVMDGGVALNR
jgi:hypothetical protein